MSGSRLLFRALCAAAFASAGLTLTAEPVAAAVEPWTNVGPTLLDLVSPDRAPYVQGTDYRVMPGSGSGDVTAILRSVDVAINPGATSVNNPNPVDTSTSGCEQADYTAAGFQAGNVALLQRGTCTFEAKVNLAIANGATAVVMFNEGQATRTTFAFGSLPSRVTIPVISTSYSVGYELYNLTLAGSVTIHVVTNTVGDTATAVTFRGLSATPSQQGVIVRWRTASEIDTLGFNVYREVNGRRVRVNTRLIASNGRGSYSFLDRKAPKAKSVRYWIQVVNADGSRNWYGPARVSRT